VHILMLALVVGFNLNKTELEQAPHFTYQIRLMTTKPNYRITAKNQENLCLFGTFLNTIVILK